MTEAAFPLAGACRCGRTGIAIAAPPLMTAACHCRGCQRMSASAYSLTAMIPADAFKVVRGAPVEGGLGGPQLDHFFCPSCKTWMFTRIVGVEAFVNVRPTLLEDLRWCEPFIETMTAERLAWARTPARHSYAGFPPAEDLEPLMRAFAARP